MITCKICPTCKENKDISHWDKNKARYDGVHSRCKICRRKCEKEYNIKRRLSHKFTKKEIIIDHYTKCKRCCILCGYNDIRALQVDHINNDGEEHRKIIPGKHLYPWIIKNNFPKDLQILCANCNNIKRANKKKKKVSKIKLLVISNYSSGKICCKRCKFSEIKGLQIDHIKGGGHKHIKSINKEFYSWLIENNFPEGFQVLCANCNWIKRHENNEFRNQYSVV